MISFINITLLQQSFCIQDTAINLENYYWKISAQSTQEKNVFSAGTQRIMKFLPKVGHHNNIRRANFYAGECAINSLEAHRTQITSFK